MLDKFLRAVINTGPLRWFVAKRTSSFCTRGLGQEQKHLYFIPLQPVRCTIEVFIDTNYGVGTPNYVEQPVGAFCCSAIANSNSDNPALSPHPSTTGHTYTWDADRQECRWLQYADCDDLPPFNLLFVCFFYGWKDVDVGVISSY